MKITYVKYVFICLTEGIPNHLNACCPLAMCFVFIYQLNIGVWVNQYLGWNTVIGEWDV